MESTHKTFYGDGIVNISSGSIINFITYNSNVACIDENGNFGINKSNPAYSLDVSGSINASSNLLVGGIPIVSSQWITKTGSNVLYSINSNVGVRTSNPAYSLDVSGSINASSNLLVGGIPIVSSQWITKTDSNVLYSINSNVGIGLSNPLTSLEVNGNVRVRSNLEILGNFTVRGLIETIVMFPSSSLSTSNPIGTLDGITYTFNNTNQFGNWNGNWWYDYNYNTSLTCGAYTSGIFNGVSATSNVDGFNVIRGQMSTIIGSSNFVLKGYRFENSNESINTLPSKLYLLGSLDNTNWSTIDSYIIDSSNVYSSAPFGGNITGLDRQIQNTTSYRYYRLMFNELFSGSSFIIQEFRWYISISGNTQGSTGGGVTDTNKDTFISAESFPTNNDDTLRFFNSNNETMRITSTGRIGISNQSPSERLEVSGGNAKFNSNAYIIERLGIANSNPSERLELLGNAKISNNLYVLNNIGVGLSNPSTTLEVNGGVKLRSNLEVLGDLTIRGTTTTMDSTTVNIVDNIIRLNNGAAFSSSLQAGIEVNRGVGYSNYLIIFDEVTDSLQSGMNGALKVIPNIDGTSVSNGVLLYDNTNKKITSCNNFVYSGTGLGIDKVVPTEQLDINKNAKINSNLYVLNRIGVATSNPTVSVEINATDAILIPKGTTVQRPSVPSQGQIRYNTQINTFEGYGVGNVWESLGGVKDANQDTYISAESFPTSNDDNLVFYNSNIERMRLTKVGLLGIGISNPTYALEVNGNVKIYSNVDIIGNLTISGTTHTINSTTVTIADNIIRLNNGAAFNSSLQSGIEINRGAGNSNYYIVYDEISDVLRAGFTGVLSAVATRDDSPASFSIPYYSFATSNYTSVSQFVYSNNNLGIGVTNPTYKIDTNGTVRIAQSNGVGLLLESTGPINITLSNNRSGRSILGLAYNAGDYSSHARSNDLVMRNERTDGNIILQNGVTTSALLINSNNFVGIGTNTPTVRLDVSGTTNSSSGYTSGTAILQSNDSQYGNWKVTGNAQGSHDGIRFTTADITVVAGNAGIKRSGFYNNGVGWSFYIDENRDVFCPGDITAYWSDKRLKSNLCQIKDHDYILSSLTAYRFNWNEKGQKILQRSKDDIEVGLIAQDVQSVLPQAVKINKSGISIESEEDFDYLTINYDKLVPILIEGYKEQKLKIKELEDKMLQTYTISAVNNQSVFYTSNIAFNSLSDGKFNYDASEFKFKYVGNPVIITAHSLCKNSIGLVLNRGGNVSKLELNTIAGVSFIMTSNDIISFTNNVESIVTYNDDNKVVLTMNGI
jgi:hypothetical protein